MKTTKLFLIFLMPFFTFASETMNLPGNKPALDPYVAGPVKNTITKRAKNIQECWFAAQKKNPKLEKVKVEIDWQIQPTGKVEAAELLRSEVEDKNFSDCLLKKIQAISFPPHEGKVARYISHKFTFTKEN